MKLLAISILLFAFTINNKVVAQQWFNFANEDSLYNPGGYSVVESMYAKDNFLYVGGGLNKAGNLNLNGIAKWDGHNWFQMGNGIQIGGILTINEFNNSIYAGGYFSDLNGQPNSEGIGRFNGTNWVALPNSTGNNFGSPFSIIKFNSLLVIGGAGFYVNGTVYWRIIAYDGSNFIYFGSTPDNVMTLKVYNGEIYAGGGWFSLKKKVGNNWNDVGGQCDDYIQSMEVDTFNNFLYVCGGFNTVDDTILSNGVAIWNGFYWERVGPIALCYGDIMRLKLYHGNLYAGTANGYISCNYLGFLARWDGQTWYPVGDTIRWQVNAMEIFKDTLYAGGWYHYENGINIGTIGKWYIPPDSTCNYLQPRVFALNDTFYLSGGLASVQFYNNNAFVNSWQWDFGDSGTDNVKDPLHIYNASGTYTATVTVTHNGCTKTAQKIISVLNGSDLENYTKEKLNFKIYPNPTRSDFTVELTLPNNVSSELRAYSSIGTLLDKYHLQKGVNKITISANLLTKGESLIGLFVNGKQVLVEKVIKK